MATLQCNSLPLNKTCHRRRRPFNSVFSSTRFISSLGTSAYTNSSRALKTSTSRWGCTVSAVVSEENAVGPSFSATDVFKLTYLEVGFYGSCHF
ncbi:hypothetical protein SESBI_38274 [Sesbania bispinosa]|nr:hypothetical protein SESBI_38274 [Sesbania bispinosa]